MSSDSREGELFVTKTSKLFFQGRSGIVRKFHPSGTMTPDEEHVTVDWLNGHLGFGNTEKLVDSGSGKFWGIPYKRTGKAFVKWIAARNNTSFETLDEEDLPPNSEQNHWFAKLGGHEKWDLKSYTDSGWALATDPWGETEHWLPPRWRLKSGPRVGQVVDQIYCFTRENGKYRYEVTMQQTIEP